MPLSHPKCTSHTSTPTNAQTNTHPIGGYSTTVHRLARWKGAWRIRAFKIHVRMCILPYHIQIQQPTSSAEKSLLTLRHACFQVKPASAICVQKFDDSQGLAIRITYRISLRSSSLWEPRHPLLKVVFGLDLTNHHTFYGAMIYQWY
jgi:hypothetical protein